MVSLVRWTERAAAVRNDSRGQLLIEVLIALAILGLIATVFIGAMYTSLQAARVTDERSVTLTLAKSQIEYVRTQEYSTIDNWDYTITTIGWSATNAPSWLADKPEDYIGLSSEFEGYSVDVSGRSDHENLSWATRPGIRAITATVFHHGEEVLTLENYEVDRG